MPRLLSFLSIALLIFVAVGCSGEPEEKPSAPNGEPAKISSSVKAGERGL